MNELQKSMFMGNIFIYMYINIAIFIHNIMSYHNSARENWFVVTQVLLFLHTQYSSYCVFSEESFQCFSFCLSNCYPTNKQKQTEILMAHYCGTLQFFI